MAAFTRTTALRAAVGALAVSVTTALAAPAVAAPTAPAVPDTGAISLESLPGDAELAAALRQLKELGAGEAVIKALQTILQSEGQSDLSSMFGSLGDGDGEGTAPTTPANPTAPDVPDTAPAPAVPAEPTEVAAPVREAATPAADPLDAITLLEQAFGVKALTPALAPFCTDPTPDNPLGLVAAPAVAIPGPKPAVNDNQLVDVIKRIFGDKVLKDLEFLSNEDTAFALVPPADSKDPKFQVAWFNVQTMQGGLEDLGAPSDIVDDPVVKQLLDSLQAPLRLAKVKTGQGTILTAVFGTADTNGRTCYFLPAVGVVETPDAK